MSDQPYFPSRNPPLIEAIYVKYDDDAEDIMIQATSGLLFSDGELEQLTSHLNEDYREQFDQGEGLYLFRADWFDGQYGPEGFCEIAPSWMLVKVAYVSFDIPVEK